MDQLNQIEQEVYRLDDVKEVLSNLLSDVEDEEINIAVDTLEDVMIKIEDLLFQLREYIKNS